MTSSLVKYDTATLVTTTRVGKRKPGKAPTADAGVSPATGEILNSILPPREWTDDGALWVQYVSSTPATRLDVIQLQERLDQKLQERQARETGICPIREELYTQCFGAFKSRSSPASTRRGLCAPIPQACCYRARRAHCGSARYGVGLPCIDPHRPPCTRRPPPPRAFSASQTRSFDR